MKTLVDITFVCFLVFLFFFLRQARRITTSTSFENFGDSWRRLEGGRARWTRGIHCFGDGRGGKGV